MGERARPLEKCPECGLTKHGELSCGGPFHLAVSSALRPASAGDGPGTVPSSEPKGGSSV